MAKLIKLLSPSFFSALFVAVIPFWFGWKGIGYYARVYWFRLLAFSFFSGSCIFYLSSFVFRKLTLEQFRFFPSQRRILFLTLAFFLSYLVGWLMGLQARKAYCWIITKKIKPIQQALEVYKSKYGLYPSELKYLPEFHELSKRVGVKVEQEKFEFVRVYSSEPEQNVALFHLATKSYEVIVPVSGAPFYIQPNAYVYFFDSQKGRWAYRQFRWSFIY